MIVNKLLIDGFHQTRDQSGKVSAVVSCGPSDIDGAVIDRHRDRAALPKGLQKGLGIVRLKRRDHVQPPTIFGVSLFSSDQDANAFGVEPVANPAPMLLGSPLSDHRQRLRDKGIAIIGGVEFQAHEIKEVPEPVGGADIRPVVLSKFHPHGEENCPSSVKMSSTDFGLIVSPPNRIRAFHESRTTTAADAAPARFSLNSAATGSLVSGDEADDGADPHCISMFASTNSITPRGALAISLRVAGA